MCRSEYFDKAFAAYSCGQIDEDTYDTIITNADIFCDDKRNGNLPSYYAEVEYDDFDNPEAIEGAKFDDRNYLHYTER